MQAAAPQRDESAKFYSNDILCRISKPFLNIFFNLKKPHLKPNQELPFNKSYNKNKSKIIKQITYPKSTHMTIKTAWLGIMSFFQHDLMQVARGATGKQASNRQSGAGVRP